MENIQQEQLVSNDLSNQLVESTSVDMTVFDNEEVQSGTQEGKNLQDELYKDLSEKQVNAYRDMQSRVDSTLFLNQRLHEENEKLTQYSTFLNELLEDDQVFEAFVSERNPNLLQPKDPLQIVEATLKKEFGEEYNPEEDSTVRKTLYYERARELYSQTKNKKDVLPTLKELKGKRLQEQQIKEAETQKVHQEIKQSLQWDDSMLDNFRTWAFKLKPVELAKMYQFALRRSAKGNQFIASQSGTSHQVNPLLRKVDDIFGK